MVLEYKNKYGYVKFKTIEDPQPMNTIKSSNYNTNIFLSFDDSEKIVLITGNYKIQLSCIYKDNKISDKMFLIFNDTSKTGSACKVLELKFDKNINAEEELEKLNKYQSMSDFLKYI